MRASFVAILGLASLVSATARADDPPQPSPETTPSAPPSDEPPTAPAPQGQPAAAPAPTVAPPPTAVPEPTTTPAPTTAPASTAVPVATSIQSAGDAKADAAKSDAVELEAILEEILPDHARVVGEVGVGLQLASNRNGGSVIGTIDVTALHPAWFRVRGRGISGSFFVDTLAGVTIRHRRGLDEEAETLTETVGETETVYIRRYSTMRTKLIARRDLVIAAGLKHEYAHDDRDMNPDVEGSGFHSQIFMAGVQKHFATNAGSHDYVELYGLYNMHTGHKGFQAIWHNSASFLPTIFGRRMYGGMELAWLPTDAGSEFYFGLVDLGVSFER